MSVRASRPETPKFHLENLVYIVLGDNPWLHGVGETWEKGYGLSVIQSQADIKKFMETEHFLESSCFLMLWNLLRINDLTNSGCLHIVFA